MSNAVVVRWFQQRAQGMHHYVAEWLRICSVYLGIAVIVTVSMGFAIPGLRQQALQVHSALLTALAPASVQRGAGTELGLKTLPDTGPVFSAGMPSGAGSQNAGLPGASVDDALAAQKKSVLPVSGPQIEALRSYISRKYRIAYNATGPLIDLAYREARDKRLDPLLVLAVIAIESRYNPLAESHAGAQGLMQVMTRVHRDKFEALGNDDSLDPMANIQVGTTILRDCIARRGSVDAGLGCYVGATGPNDGGYAAKVQAERRRLALASGIALIRD